MQTHLRGRDMITTRLSPIRLLFIVSLIVFIAFKWEIARSEELKKAAKAKEYKDARHDREEWLPPWAAKSSLTQMQFEEMKNSEAYLAAVSTVQWMLWKFGYFDTPPMTGNEPRINSQV